jgi:hypothetical protein
MEWLLVGMLALFVLVLVIFPALLYLMGWGAIRLTRKTPARVGLTRPPSKELSESSSVKTPRSHG